MKEEDGAALWAETDLLSLDCPAVAMRLEDVMKAKSPQVFVWHCQLCQQGESHGMLTVFCWNGGFSSERVLSSDAIL